MLSTHQEGELIFEEEFDTLDFRKWQHEITLAGGGNWEFQVPEANFAKLLYGNVKYKLNIFSFTGTTAPTRT